MKHFRNHLFSLAGVGIFLFLALATKPTGNNNNRTSSPNTTRYVNSRANFSGKLSDNYVDFSFDYPSTWKTVPDTSNFIKVENKNPGGDTIENFAVGWVSGPMSMMPQFAQQLSDQSAKGFPEYKKVSEGETKIGPYEGYEFRFSSHMTTAEGEADIWGRIVLLPSEGARKGAALVMLASSASPDVHGPEDVGEKGEIPTILKSFRFGP
ncbi:MAG: hypothetical protein ACMG6H_08840 [Acidobacteriota bacterium]